MSYTIEREYFVNSTRRLTSPVADILAFDIPFDGDIVEISLVGDSGSGTCTFSVNLDGVPLYTGGDRPSIATTETTDTKTGLTDPVLFGQRLSLSLTEVSGSGLRQRLSWIVTIDDGSGGGGPSAPTVIVDEPFTGGTINSAIWDTPGAGTSQGSGKLTITASTHEQLTSKSSIVVAPTLTDGSWHNKQITAKIPTVAQSGTLATQFFISYAAALGTYYRGFQIYNGNLSAICQGQSLLKNITYNAVDHLWLRIRDICGVTSFWVSANGTDWKMVFAAEPNVGGLFDAYNPFYIILRLYNVSGGPATIEFDQIKLEDLNVWFPN